MMAGHIQKPYASAGEDVSTAQAHVYNDNPWSTFNTQPEWSRSPHWRPDKNPFLRRLYKMRRLQAVLSVGGSATFVHTSRSSRRGVNLWAGGITRAMYFFQGPDVRTAGSRVDPKFREWFQAVAPYSNPYYRKWQPPLPVYGTFKRDGYQTSDLLVLGLGQMGYENSTPAPPIVPTGVNYMPSDLMFRERSIVKFKIVSYGRPVVGGRTWYHNDMDPQTDFSKYLNTYPTAAPTQSKPNISA